MTTAKEPPFLRLEAISKNYGAVQALAGVDLEVRRGEFVTFLGPSGSGKSTTLMAIAGFVQPSSGRICRHGIDISNLPAEKRDFGMVFQGYALFPHMTVAQNVAYPLRVRRWPERKRTQAVHRALEQVGLQDFGARKPAELSGGQQQRVALARALVFDPEVLLLDEPLGALDKNMRKQLQAELKKLHREVGKTFIFVTHDQEEALALSDRVAIFNKGRLEQFGTPEDVYSRPVNRFVATFVGETNLIPTELLMKHGGSVAGIQPGGAVSVRPEFVTITSARPQDGSIAIPARINERLFHGSQVQFSLTGPCDVPLVAQVRADNLELLRDVDRGGSCWFSWPTSAGVAVGN